jgi:hypothetical protein
LLLAGGVDVDGTVRADALWAVDLTSAAPVGGARGGHTVAVPARIHTAVVALLKGETPQTSS